MAGSTSLMIYCLSVAKRAFSVGGAGTSVILLAEMLNVVDVNVAVVVAMACCFSGAVQVSVYIGGLESIRGYTADARTSLSFSLPP